MTVGSFCVFDVASCETALSAAAAAFAFAASADAIAFAASAAVAASAFAAAAASAAAAAVAFAASDAFAADSHAAPSLPAAAASFVLLFAAAYTAVEDVKTISDFVKVGCRARVSACEALERGSSIAANCSVPAGAPPVGPLEVVYGPSLRASDPTAITRQAQLLASDLPFLQGQMRAPPG
ncbi:hypothetical protein Efla_006345 [Eimeria flavescens]